MPWISVDEPDESQGASETEVQAWLAYRRQREGANLQRHEAAFVDRVPRSLLEQGSVRRQTLFDFVAVVAHEPFPPTRDEASPHHTVGDVAVTSTPFAALITNAAGEQRAFDAIRRQTGHPSGEINVSAVLVHIFLFLPCDEATLCAVGRVSSHWRAASELLPQWALIPRLCRVHDESYELNLCVLAEGSLHVNRCLTATTRSEVMAVFRERLDLFDAATGSTRRFGFIYAAHFCISTVISTLALASAVGIGWSAFRDPGGDNDGTIGMAMSAALIFVFLPLGFIVHVCAVNCVGRIHDEAQRSRAGASQSPALVAMLVTLLMLCIPTGLLSARVAEAVHMRDSALSDPRDVVALQYATNTSRTPPLWVSVRDVQQWMARPFLSALESSNTSQRKCLQEQGPSITSTSLFDVTNRSAWWADMYVTRRGNTTCIDTTFGSPTTVYLWPPSTGPYAGARPIAVAVSASLSTLLSTFFTTQAQAATANTTTGAMAWFRVPLSQPWLSVSPSYDAWYTCDSTAVLCRATGWGSGSSAKPTLLVAADLGPYTPDSLVWKWLGRLIAMPCISVVVFLLMAIPTYIGWRRSSSSIPDNVAFYAGLVMLNPLWFAVFSFLCWGSNDGDTCMINPDIAAVMGFLSIATAIFQCFAAPGCKGFLVEKSDDNEEE